MSSKLVPANPADVMVIRNITPNVATFSVPFARFGKLKVGGRGTLGKPITFLYIPFLMANTQLVKLTSGDLAVFSPVAFTDATRAKILEMGGLVRYIVALDIEHHIFISQWAKEYPDAKLIGPEGLQEKRHKQTDEKIGKESFDVIFTKEKKKDIKISDEFDADFDYEYVDGHGNLELVFCYRPDKILIEADLLFNLPAIEQYSRVPDNEKPDGGISDKLFTGIQSTDGDVKWMQRFNWYLIARDRKSYTESVKVIDSWNFDTIIPCHGDVLEKNGKEIYTKVFDWHLHSKK